MSDVSAGVSVSVVIPVLNGASRICRAIDSALQQTTVTPEIIVVDDGSSDDLAAVLAPYGQRVTIVRHDQPRGASASCNSGFERSTGEVIAFLDHDDWWPPDLLSLATRVSAGHAVCYDLWRVREAPDGTFVQDSPPNEYARARPLSGSITVGNMIELADGAPLLKSLVHRDDVRKVGGYDARFYGVEDYYFHVKLVASGITLQIVDEPKGFYRLHEQSTTFTIRHAAQLDRQVQASATWALMYRVMPDELALEADFRGNCRRNRAYWSLRHWSAVVRRAVRLRTLRGLGDVELARELFPAVAGVLWVLLRQQRTQAPDSGRSGS